MIFKVLMMRFDFKHELRGRRHEGCGLKMCSQMNLKAVLNTGVTHFISFLVAPFLGLGALFQSHA